MPAEKRMDAESVLPESLRSWRWTTDMIERKMYEYSISHTKSDRAREAFHRYDRGNTGEITLEMLKREFANADLILSDESARQLFNRYDVDGDGRVTVNDFTQYLHNMRHWQLGDIERYEKSDIKPVFRASAVSMTTMDLIVKMQDKIRELTIEDGRGLRNAFRLFDRAKQGWFGAVELGLALNQFGLHASQEQLDDMVRVFDLDGDGRVNQADFNIMVMSRDYHYHDRTEAVERLSPRAPAAPPAGAAGASAGPRPTPPRRGSGASPARPSPRAKNVQTVARTGWLQAGGATTETSGESSWRSKQRKSAPETGATKIPGYSGWIQHKQLVAGRTFANTVRVAEDPRFDYHGNTIPPAPQHVAVENKVTAPHIEESARGRIPGYKGFVPGARDEFGQSFTKSTSSPRAA